MAGEKSGGQERELKFRVADGSAFTALAQAAGTSLPQAVTQVNHFFDTTDFHLNSAKYTLRLREEKGAFILGSKSPETKSPDGTLTIKSEEEVVVNRDEANAILRGTVSPLDVLERKAPASAAPLIKAIRQIIGKGQLVFVGSFQNERSRLPITLSTNSGPITFQFEMDRTTFPGNRVDHEVEIELMDVDVNEATAAIKAFLASVHIMPEGAPSKAKRLFDILTTMSRASKGRFDTLTARLPTRDGSADEPKDLHEALQRAQTVTAGLRKWLGYAQGFRSTNQASIANSHIEDVSQELIVMIRVLVRWPETAGVVAQLEHASKELPANVERASELIGSAYDALLALERQRKKGT